MTRGLGLESPAISEPRIASSECRCGRARSTISEMLPFEQGPEVRRRSRDMPGGTSGQASSRCQARLKYCSAFSAMPEMLNAA